MCVTNVSAIGGGGAELASLSVLEEHYEVAALLQDAAVAAWYASFSPYGGVL